MKLYTHKDESFLSNMDMNSEELDEMANMFYDAYDAKKDKAYQFLDKANEALNDSEAIKYIKKALNVYPECFEAKIMLAAYEDNPLKVLNMIEEAVNTERKLLSAEGLLSNNVKLIDAIQILPFIHGLYNLAYLYAGSGMINKALEVAKETLKYDNDGTTEVRELLMALYAYREDGNNLNKIYKKYNEDNLDSLIPYLVYYFKQGNYSKAREYLDTIMKYNKHFKCIFDEISPDDLIGDAKPHEKLEVKHAGANLAFLLDTVPALEIFVKNNGKIE